MSPPLVIRWILKLIFNRKIDFYVIHAKMSMIFKQTTPFNHFHPFQTTINHQSNISLLFCSIGNGRERLDVIILPLEKLQPKANAIYDYTVSF